MSTPAESTTDAHPAKRERKPPHPAWQTVMATAISAALVGGGGAVVRGKDVERIEARQDRAEADAKYARESVIELKADSRNQDRKLDDIKMSVDAMRASVDAMRDRMPR